MPDKSFTIHDLPVSERPRERLTRYGAENLSVQELLSLILGRGISGESVTVTSQRLLSHFGGIKGISEASVEELSQVKGIGPAKAAQIKAVFELAKRVDSTDSNGEKSVVTAPEDIVKVIGNRLKGKKREHFLTIMLDTRGKHIRTSEISVGDLNSSIVHPREVFREALSASAASVIFVHNHPSGDPSPSEDDIRLTKRLVNAGEIMGIDVLDHIIMVDTKWKSLKREGLF